jgi:aspartyl-tRNA synthetase
LKCIYFIDILILQNLSKQEHILTDFTKRTFSSDLGINDIGKEVSIMGWVDSLRDHGDILFIHLRDRSGIVQVVFNPEKSSPRVIDLAGTLKNEFCIGVSGHVTEREPDTKNPVLSTGDIEIIADELEIYGKSPALPFAVSEKAAELCESVSGTEPSSEEIRMQYRYLDLRRPSMQDNIIKRYRICKCIRDFLDTHGFVEIETPMLTKSTPEGARDYLVPSRIHQKRFYALPQSPQLFKQLLMISGFERYFQIVRCFRDEDLRPNRQPEFTQLDIEASFIDEEFIYELVEGLVIKIFEIGGINLPRPFPRMTYNEAIDTMGSDRPDLRFGMKFEDITDIFANTGYEIFRQILKQQGVIKGIKVENASHRLSKNVLQNEYAKQIVPGFGAKGMTWMRVVGNTLQSNIIQFFSKEEQKATVKRFSAKGGDVILMIADPSPNSAASALGHLRLHVAERLGLIPDGVFSPVWVTRFPLFEETDEGISSNHHPFTAPDRRDFNPRDRGELLSLRSRSYDLVVNGEELGGGSIRINDSELQNRIFEALGLTESDIGERFEFFIKALQYGAPPHGGIALGMDRVVSMILGTPSIREVIAFPKNRSAYCPLTGAPSRIAGKQLHELGLLDFSPAITIPGMHEEKDLIDSLSWLSRIGIKDEEKVLIESALDDAVRLGSVMKEHAGGEEPAFSAVTLVNRSRSGDTARMCELAENGDLLKNAPSVTGGFFKVANIIE